LFITDAEFAHVHLFNRQGQLLMLLGGPKNEPGGTPMPAGIAIARVPDSLAELVPADFHAHYYVIVSNSIASKRLSLFAVGQSRSST
jgi:hypothetical protein